MRLKRKRGDKNLSPASLGSQVRYRTGLRLGKYGQAGAALSWVKNIGEPATKILGLMIWTRALDIHIERSQPGGDWKLRYFPQSLKDAKHTRLSQRMTDVEVKMVQEILKMCGGTLTCLEGHGRRESRRSNIHLLL